MENSYIITCISHRRPENVEKIIETTGTDEIIFVVNDSIDYEQYSEKGAICIIGGSLTKNRNAALEYCFLRNKICVQIDDDLKKTSINHFDGKRSGITTTVLNAIETLLPKFIDSDYLYAGAPPTDNPFFALKPEQENILITAPFTLTKPNSIRYDENLKLKEDYDYSLQHMKDGTGCIRYSEFLFSFKSNVGEGGAVDYRTAELEQGTIRYLLRKWPNCIKLNTKRENEILIDRNAYKTLTSNQTSLF